MSEQHRPWERYFDVLVRQRRLILGTLAAGCALAALIALVRAPVFVAATTLMVSSDRPRLAVSPDPKTGPVVDRVTDQDLKSEVALLQSPALIRTVLVERGAADDAVAGDGWPARIDRLLAAVTNLPNTWWRAYHGLPPFTPLDAAVSDVAHRLNVTAVQGSNLIQVSYRDTDAAGAAAFANALAAAHVQRRVLLNPDGDTQRFFEQQRQLLTETVRRADAAVRAFQEREGIRPLPEEHGTLRQRAIDTDSALAKTTAELAEATARIEFLQRELRAHPRTDALPATTGEHDPAQLVRSRLVELELQRSALVGVFTPDSERMTQLDQQLRDARRLLTSEQARRDGLGAANPTYQYLELNLAQTAANQASLTARRDALQRQHDEVIARLDHLDRVGAEGERLERQRAAATEALQAYIRKEEEARFSTALDASGIVNVSVVEPAAVPAVPVEDGLTAFLIGAALSLVVALAAAFARDRFDPYVRSAGDAYDVAGLPVLAEVTG
jgi:uncharacterized protein involved in exopolysaccharide biosynthesis